MQKARGSGGFISTLERMRGGKLWASTSSKELEWVAIPPTQEKCSRSSVNVSSPLSSRENTLSCWYYSIQWIIQFSYQLHYSICLPKSLPLSHPHISNSRHPSFCREQSLVLCYTPGTNPGAQDTDLSPDNPSHHPHPPGHLCNLLDLSQILPHLRFPTALNHAPYITSELGQFLNSSPNNSLPELGHLTPLTRVFFC